MAKLRKLTPAQTRDSWGDTKYEVLDDQGVAIGTVERRPQVPSGYWGAWVARTTGGFLGSAYYTDTRRDAVDTVVTATAKGRAAKAAEEANARLASTPTPCPSCGGKLAFPGDEHADQADCTVCDWYGSATEAGRYAELLAGLDAAVAADYDAETLAEVRAAVRADYLANLNDRLTRGDLAGAP